MPKMFDEFQIISNSHNSGIFNKILFIIDNLTCYDVDSTLQSDAENRIFENDV